MTQKRRSSLWSWAGHLLTLVFVGLVVWLIASRVQSIDWRQVGASLEGYRATTLLLAAALVVLSYALYAGFDLLGRRYTQHGLPPQRVALIAFVSYAFNLNFGAWIGGIGLRYRLYSRHGLRPGLIARILGLSLATNWLGYLCLGGIAFVLRWVPMPAGWRVGADGLQWLGMLMLIVAGAYLGMCAVARRRLWKLGRAEIHLPPLRMALAQLALSVANWTVMACIVYVLLRASVPLQPVIGVLLLAAIAGVLTHIPGGLGVIEAVFVALLASRVPEAKLLAALVAYRGIYFLAPGALAVALYLGLEQRARHARVRGHAHSH
jgi:glycosyltransferase 2 family protein